MTAPTRRQELALNVAQVRERVAAAAVAAARDPDELTLIAVTKFFPSSDAAELADLGVMDLGESRDQEAARKAQELPSLTLKRPRWHFIGRLQTNKAASVASYADVVQSVDRPALVSALAKGVERANRRPLPVLIQISLDGDTERGGAKPAEVANLAELLSAERSLSLAGVMAVAPMTADPSSAFAQLNDMALQLRAQYPQATILSAGMSADLEAAVAHGATHLRVGTALLGPRSSTFR